MSTNTAALVERLQTAGEDFEWYPTTDRMVDAVIADLTAEDRDAYAYRPDVTSILDIGAGDGRVLLRLAEAVGATRLYGIEKSAILRQHQPESVIPVGTEFLEQDLMGLPVDVVFCNPPYGQFEAWAERIIRTAHATRLYLVLPQRWEDSELIAGALRSRRAAATVIHRDDFHDADRRARAVVHIIRIERKEWRHDGLPDPFDVWFDENIHTFDKAPEVSEFEQTARDLARLRSHRTITDLVESFNEDYARMQANYQAIFALDHALLQEVGVNKQSVREAIKTRMKGLKDLYWHSLFEHLDVITARLATKTKQRFLQRLTGQTAIAFTADNAYAVVLWAIKAANHYFDPQLIDLFRELSTRDGVFNYASNRRTWEKNGWRYNAEEFSHYGLDYRIVLPHYTAIWKGGFGEYDYPGGLHKSCHELIDDVVAVFGNLGFKAVSDIPPRSRVWRANTWQDWYLADGRPLFQVKAFLNGNLHFRFDQRAIRAFNIEAGRLLGWLRSPADVVAELGYSADEAEQFFGSNYRLQPRAVALLREAA